MAEVVDIESNLQQIRDQQRAAMAKSAQQQQPQVNFDEKLKSALLASNTNLKNQASAAGTSVSASSVLSNVVKQGSTTKSSSGSSSSKSGAASSGGSGSSSKSSKNKSKGGIGTSSGGLSSAPNVVAGSSLNNSTSVAGVGSASTATANNGDAALSATGTGTTTDSTSASNQLLQATQQMQELDQNFNLQYLQLQENMQAENRQYSAVSNVMKTKQDTAKNSLSNLK